MRYKVNPEYGARVREENVVIGHKGKYTIVRKDGNRLFSIIDPYCVLALGTYVSDTGLKPIEELPLEVYNDILKLCEV